MAVASLQPIRTRTSPSRLIRPLPFGVCGGGGWGGAGRCVGVGRCGCGGCEWV